MTTIVKKLLVDKFGMSQGLSGFIMALDNILALFMLPLFGYLSDKTKHKIRQKDAPYIIVGTLLAAVLFVGTTFADNVQLLKLKDVTDNNYLYESGIHDEPSLKIGQGTDKEVWTARERIRTILSALPPTAKTEQIVKTLTGL
jgi:hypothetical protein